MILPLPLPPRTALTLRPLYKRASTSKSGLCHFSISAPWQSFFLSFDPPVTCLTSAYCHLHRPSHPSHSSSYRGSPALPAYSLAPERCAAAISSAAASVQNTLELGLVTLLTRPVLKTVFASETGTPSESQDTPAEPSSQSPVEEVSQNAKAGIAPRTAPIIPVPIPISVPGTQGAQLSNPNASSTSDMNATTPTQATFAPPPVIADPATQGAKRDTFGGNDDVNGLAQATNNMAIVDTSPGKATWDWDDNRPSPNGVVNPAANGGPIANGGSAVPRRMPTGGAVPLESPALFMPGGPQVNPSVPGERPGLAQRPSRSYRGQKPEIVTHYEKPLDERPSSVLQPKSSGAVGAVVAPDIRPKSASRSNSRKSIPKAVPPPTSPPPAPPVTGQTQTPTAAAFPVPPGDAPPVPAQQQAAAVTAAPTATGVPDPYDYEQARSNFYSVPDPTRPETAQAYREEREPVPEVSPETKPMDGPTSHPTLIAPVPIPMNNNVRRTSMPRAEPTGYPQNAAPVDNMATPQARPQSRTSYPQNASPVNAMASPQARPQAQNLMASPQARPHPHNLSRNSSHYSARNQPLSPSASIRGQRLPPIQDGAVHVGDVMTFDQQQRLQGGSGMHTPRGHQLVDNGPIDKPLGRSVSLDRRRSFGHRPQPILMEDEFGAGGRDSRAESWYGPDHRTNMVGRSNTTRSRATTGRNGTLSRASNGGTIGRRAGAFGMGAGLSVGTQPEEILGREDIHARAEVSDRQLDRDTLRRLSQMEKKDARKLEKLMKEEERAQARSLEHSIRDLKHLAKMQKEAIANERKSQSHLAKWTGREHRARMRFLKEKERYEKVENILRGAENDFEERRDHAAGLTAQIAERTQEIDDLRAQKAADDRERRVKKHAMRNPAYA